MTVFTPSLTSWSWRSFGGALILVTESGGSQVILTPGDNGLLTRSEKTGLLIPLTEGHPIARLIAAAPELLGALRDLLESETYFGAEVPIDVYDAFAARFTHARTIIAKVEGRTDE